MDIHNRKIIEDLEKSHLSLEVRKFPEKLDEILADDFLEIGSSGDIFNKKDCINGVSLDELFLYDFELHPLAPQVVLTTYYLTNKSKNRNTRRSSIWKYIDKRWQLYFHQGTVTNDKVSDLNRNDSL
ncbi:MAG: DUF4440 domain-containing protein [Anaerobacillus sp.]